MKLVILLLTVATLVTEATTNEKDFDDRLDFDFDDENVETKQVSTGGRDQALQESLLRAMQKPAFREQIGQVIPILRVMSPQQRLTLAALVSAQIMAPQHADQHNLADVAHMFSSPGQNTKNVSEQLLLPISMDIAKMFRGLAGDTARSWRSTSWKKEDPVSRPINLFTTEPFSKTQLSLTEDNLRKRQGGVSGPNEVNRRNGIDDLETPPDAQDCDFLTTDICQEVAQYPEAEILGSIKKHLTLMEPFLTDHDDEMDDYHDTSRAQRRQDGGNELGSGEGFMCPSTVKHAKPKRARTTSGAWKYIVNTGDYSQTLRLEMCLKPGASCSYLNDHFRSLCNQVYNYHRLMCWDEKRGLHMDIFKVPSCCSCHVQGYLARFPPQDFPFAEKRKEVDTITTVQSTSGVKREIPRPNLIGRPDTASQLQTIPSSGKRENYNPVNFHIEDSQGEIQQNMPQRPLFQLQDQPQKPFSQQNGPQRQHPFKNNQNLQRPSQYNHVHPNTPAQPERLHSLNYPQSNVELQGTGSAGGLIDHLVPPGPPLPLDFERPRPSFNQRRNTTFNRTPEFNVISNTKRPQNLEHTQGKQSARPKRPFKSTDTSAQSSENTRVHFKPAEGSFGSKIRGQKPVKQNKPVYVTPIPIPPSDVTDQENTVRVTPKPPQKNSVKKVNYNYHPIIDFFAHQGNSGQQAPRQPLAPSHFNPRIQQNTQTYYIPQQSSPSHYRAQQSSQEFALARNDQDRPQYSQPDNQNVSSPHEWTPML